MKTRYDPHTDALDLRFADAPVAESEEVVPGVMIDFDAQGQILAIEVLDASSRLNEHATLIAGTAPDHATVRVQAHIDVSRLRALTATRPPQNEGAASFVRAMRDSDNY